jgi:hypothetical protein
MPDDNTEVCAFVVSDDEKGPFEVIEVEEIVDSLLSQVSPTAVLVPLPDGVWLNGPNAERLGARVFRAAVENCASSLRSYLDRQPLQVADEAAKSDKEPESDAGELSVRLEGDRADAMEVLANLDSLEAVVGTRESSAVRLSLRSYVVPSTDFKVGFAERCGDDLGTLAHVQLAELPRFVWVVEVMDRRRRERHEASVIGEVVLDATDLELEETQIRLVHLPGVLQVRGWPGGAPWLVSRLREPYRSGRYHVMKDWLADTRATASRWKGALD